jgi:hypothetical protein
VLVSVIGSIVVVGGRYCGYLKSLRTIAIVIRDRLYVQTVSSLLAGKDVFVKNEEKTSSSSSVASVASSDGPTVSGLFIHPGIVFVIEVLVISLARGKAQRSDFFSDNDATDQCSFFATSQIGMSRFRTECND